MSKYLFRAIATTCVVAVAVALSTPARAEDAAKSAKMKSHQFTGTIDSMDATAGTCTLKRTMNGKDETKTFKCAPDCKMVNAAGKAFAVGDKVVVMYTEDGGTAMCHSMMAPKPKMKKEKKPDAGQ